MGDICPYLVLTLCGLMMHIHISELGHHCFKCWLATFSTQNPHPKQYLLLSNRPLGNSNESACKTLQNFFKKLLSIMLKSQFPQIVHIEMFFLKPLVWKSCHADCFMPNKGCQNHSLQSLKWCLSYLAHCGLVTPDGNISLGRYWHW